jgi:alpha-1,6-mannosyltransferase
VLPQFLTPAITAAAWVQGRLGPVGTSHRRHPVVLAAVGFLATAAVVVAGGRSRLPVGMTLPRSFAGLLSPGTSGGGVAAGLVIVAVAVLLSCWWWLLREVSAGRVTMRQTAWMVAAWAAPLLLSPPVLSFDAYAYLAQGKMVVSWLDPYATGPVALGADPVLDRVDPFWRSSPCPYGPVALVMLRAVAKLDSGLVGSVLALRLLALIGVAVAVAGALLMSSPRRQPIVLALTLANPVTLLHLIGGVHLDALLAGFVVLTLLALRSGRDASALLLAAVAVALKVTVLPVFALVVVVAVRRRGIRMLWLSVPALLVPFVLSGLVLTRPWGFLHALLVPGAAAPWYAPASLVGNVLRLAAGLGGLPVGEATTGVVGQVLVFLTGTAVVGRVLVLAWRDGEPYSTEKTLARAGAILLVVALALPSLHSWYLAPAVAVSAASNIRLRRIVVGLCSALTFSSLPTLYDASPWLVAAAWTVALGVLALSGVRMLSLPAVGAGSPSRGLRAAGVPAPMAPRRAERSRRLHVGLVMATRIAELMVLPALVLAVIGRGIPADADDAAATVDRAVVNQRVTDVARLTAEVTTAYPQEELAQVLPTPGSGADQQFDVELVLADRRTCWVHVVLPESDRPARFKDSPLSTPGCPPATPDSVLPSIPSRPGGN